MRQAVPLEKTLVDPEIFRLSVIFLAALSAGGIAYVFIMPLLSGERKTDKRIASVSQGKAGVAQRSALPEGASMRKKQVLETLKELEARQKSRKKLTLKARVSQAGLNVPVQSFYIASAVSGLVAGAIVYVTGSAAPVAGLAAIAGSLGFPRWLLGYLARRRQKQFLIEFANAIDVIVRGVKSGLPLNDCLRIIAEETAEPVKSEFADVVEQQCVGVPLAKAFTRLYERMPLQEVNFFSIVITIQQQTGGNLAEALDNLSQVLRGRQRLYGKVQAFSAEAKASAAIIGSLPLGVMAALAVMTPDYVMLLWTEQLGKMMLIASGIWMLIGVLVMRKMINFDY
ncbi:MAG: type II secretion system F family protein [Methyloligellaceae bacterium]